MKTTTKEMPANLKAYIVIGCDINNEKFVSVQFIDGEQLEIAELIYLLASGQLIEETIKSLRQACESDEEAQSILQVLGDLMHAHAAEVHAQQSLTKHKPVIDPTEVFNRRENNEYKG